jgi:hypothetical protein
MTKESEIMYKNLEEIKTQYRPSYKLQGRETSVHTKKFPQHHIKIDNQMFTKANDVGECMKGFSDDLWKLIYITSS